MQTLCQPFRAACAMAFLLVAALGVFADGQAAGGTSRILAAIAQENDASLRRIRNIRIEYDTQGELKEKNASRILRQSQGHLYCVSNIDRQMRLRLNDMDGQGYVVDRYIAGGVEREQSYRATLDSEAKPLLPGTQNAYRASISPAVPGRYRELIPQTLERIPFLAIAPPLTLTEIVQGWNCEIIEDDGKNVLIRAELPAGSSETHAGSYVLLKVRRDKGCRIEEARIVEVNAAQRAGTREPASVLSTFRVLAWQEPAPGLWYPQHVRFGNHGAVESSSDDLGFFVDWIITSVVVNAQDLEPWLGFSFPNNAIVVDYLKDGAALP